MALLIAYTLHDVKAVNYSPPFFMPNDALARRACAELVLDRNTTVGRHPSDFKLYRVGTFDEGNGVLTPLSIIEHVLDIISLVPAVAPELPFGSSAAHTVAEYNRVLNGEAK